MQQKKKSKPPNYRKNKLAFNNVLDRYRAMQTIGTISVSKFDESGKATPNPAKPSGLDFVCDVEKVFERVVPEKSLIKFWQVYVVSAAEDLELEKLADRVCGPRRHSWEQRCGAEFIRRGVYPVQAKYFNTLRKKRKNNG